MVTSFGGEHHNKFIIEHILTLDNLAQIHNTFCQASHILALRQTLMEQNCTVAFRIDHIFDAKNGTMMLTFRIIPPK